MKYKEMEAIRNKLGLTKKAFSKLVGIKVSTYYSYKANRKPSGAVEKILWLLKKEPEEMFQKMRSIVNKGE